MEQLSGLDSAMMLGETPNIPLHMGALFIYDPSTSVSKTLSFGQIRTLLLDVTETALPILKCRPDKLPLSIDKPYWVIDDNFVIDYHLQRFALPEPCNWDTLHEVAAHFHAQPLNHERPLWQAIYLENLDHLANLPRGCKGLLLKIHHSIADGKTAFRLFSALHTLSPEADAPLIQNRITPAKPDFSAPRRGTKYRRAYWHTVSSPFRLIKTLANMTPALWESGTTSTPGNSTSVSSAIPDTPFNTPPSADRILGHIYIPMKKMQKLEKASGCTINDIALCIIGSGLQAYIQLQGAQRQNLQQQKTPVESLVAGMPIDIRTDADNKKAIGNQLGFANVSLHTDITNLRHRLAAIHQSSTESRKKNKRLGSKSLISIVDNLHPGLLVWGGKKIIASGLINKLPRLNNTIITNVPGIPAPCYLCGAKLVDYLGFGPLTPVVTLFHVISSTDTHINITFLSCQKSLKDVHAYKLALENSYQQLMASFNIA